MTSVAEPALSILVATRNRAARLADFLESVQVAQQAPISVEILVVDNGSTDETGALLEQWERSGPGRIRLCVEQPGKSRALNHALDRAGAPLLVFTDDDVEVAPTFFTEIVAFFAAHPEYDAAIGRVLAPPHTPLSAEIAALLARYRTIALFDHGAVVRDEPTLHGANMVLRRSVFDAVGRFNEQLGPGASGGMEDQDLGERIARSGRRIGYMPNVAVYHCIEPSRLTPTYYRQFQLVQARSRLVMDPNGAWKRALPRLVESALGFAWWSVAQQPTRREHARGRMLRNADILRLQWRTRHTVRQRRTPATDEPRHILMVRTDRLGDMVVTTPLFAAVKAAFPKSRITVLASAAGAVVARAQAAVDAVEVDVEAKGSGWRGTLRLARRLRRLHCDAAVVVHSKHRLALAVWLAGIPLRIGPGQRGYSFLYNQPVTQDHRTPPIRHETAYCMDLLRPLGIEPQATARPRWTVDPADATAVDRLLRERGVGSDRAIVTIHPGHGGSSLNWTPQRYAELADCLASERDVTIAVTGAAAEAAVVESVCAAMHAPALNLAGQLSIPQLVALIARSVLYVGSSTGPSHLAAAAGTPVVALYCPLAECVPERWRPQADNCTVLVPPVGQVCPTCLGPRCQFFPCMEMIAPRTVADAAAALLAAPAGPAEPESDRLQSE